MNSQTARRTSNQRPTRTAKSKKYVKQTAHVEARRDGKPLIFGWGGHLSRSEKVRLQRRAIWSITALIALIMVAVFVIYWVNINVISPGLAISTVNGQPITQSDYRKMVAVKAQLQLNDLNGPKGLSAKRDDLKKQVTDAQKVIDDTNKQITTLNDQIKALPANDTAQRNNLQAQLKGLQQKLSDAQANHDTLNSKYQDIVQNQFPLAQQMYTQSQVGNDSVGWLQDDALITQWLEKQTAAIRANIDPAPRAIDSAVNSFKAALPTNTPYQKFLTDNRLTDKDVRTTLAVKLRRDNMQTYLAAHTTSPTYQVLVRAMVLSSKSDADKILKQLQQGKADFGTIAKQKSLDTNSKDKGGDLGWLARGQYTMDVAQKVSGTVDNWIFDPARSLNELSPVLSENGTYHIVQIMGVDPSRAVDPAKLQDLKTNALTLWTLSQRALSGASVTPADQNMLLDANNMPSGLPASAPAQTGGANGLPGGAGGLPGSTGGLPGQ